ncbi:putative carboxylesterase [Xylariaceae sp. FL0255]|nr:putative carboxylesterase [Xylariaceae sp. FL0255]
MDSIFATLRYLRLKILISLIRLLVRLFAPRIRTNPDAVLHIPSRDAGRPITVHVYNPPDNHDQTPSSNPTPKPVLLNFYGSAFTLLFFGADEGYCRGIARRTGYVVLDVEYRLAPEAPFPGPNEDVEDTVRYVLARPEKYDRKRLSASGFSSGGTLALVAPLLFPTGTFEKVIAFYPSANLVADPADRKPPVEPPEGTPSGRGPAAWTRLFREAVFLNGTDPRDPRISPLFATESQLAAHYPENLLVITGEYDSSALDAEKFGRNVEAAGKRGVVVRRMGDCIHGFDKKEEYKDAKEESYALVVDMLLNK